MIEYENLKKVNAPFFKEYERSFSETLQSGWYILGRNVGSFERDFAAYCGTGHCVGLASGLDALLLALKVFGFEKGSEVLVPSNTYIATILSVLQAGLRPVLVEPDINTYNINPDRIEEKINSRTCAIMVVHLYGKVCDMDPVKELAERHGLRIIEDCAQAHGSMYKGRKAGIFGDVAAFSFYPTKNLGAIGDAGAALTDNEDICQTLKKLRNYGSSVKYYNELIGYNSRLDEVQAGFLSLKLKKLDDINGHKRKLASIYLDNLKDDFIKPSVHRDFYDTYHIFPIRHPRRNELRELLLKNEIATEIHYPVPPSRQKAMLGVLDTHCPISDEIHSSILSLPVSFFHTPDDIYRVVEVMNSF
jgi:dTDP-4-amino-4,6-dideoxygalactose transaminase